MSLSFTFTDTRHTITDPRPSLEGTKVLSLSFTITDNQHWLKGREVLFLYTITTSRLDGREALLLSDSTTDNQYRLEGREVLFLYTITGNQVFMPEGREEGLEGRRV